VQFAKRSKKTEWCSEDRWPAQNTEGNIAWAEVRHALIQPREFLSC
jgi:hypothetical protein